MSATLYCVVNDSLKMSKGKIAAQCCHVNTKIIRLMEKQSKIPLIYMEWKHTGETTVILKAKADQFAAIFETFKHEKSDSSFQQPIMCYQMDEGRTEVLPGTITVLGFTPVRKNEAPECLKHLKIL